jgi:heat shock protein HslJ
MGFLLAGLSATAAADHGFPYDSVLLLEAKPMKGSKRVPILQIESKGDASIDLWCNTVPAQLIVVDSTITILLGTPTERHCEAERVLADEDLMAALQQVANWHREGDLLVLQGERSLRFRMSSN